jgi:hypothetical protein
MTPRTTQRWAILVGTGEEERLRRELRRLAVAQPRWGYKRIWGRLRLDGWPV